MKSENFEVMGKLWEVSSFAREVIGRERERERERENMSSYPDRSIYLLILISRQVSCGHGGEKWCVCITNFSSCSYF